LAENVDGDTSRRARGGQPEAQFEKILSRLGIDRETIKEHEEVIESPDARTVITYDVQVSQRTGAHKTIKKFSTTMQQCNVCFNYSPKLFRCEAPNCGALVCANDKRSTGWYFAHGEPRNVCISCYESSQKEERNSNEEHERLNKESREILEQSHRHTMEWQASRRR
jgi:hypothetical protein